MKERTFYTINLDLRRIVVISVVFIGLLIYFFMLGNAMGKKSVAAKDPSKDVADTSKAEMKASEKSLLKPSPEENMVPAPPEEKTEPKDSEIVDLKPSTDTTKPIPVPAPSPVQEVKEELTKKPVAINTPQPNAKTVSPVAVNPQPLNPNLPAKKPIYPYPAKKVATLPAKTPIVLEEKNIYTIQLGAFSSQEQANKFKDNVITKNKFPNKFAPYVLKQRDFFVVQVGKSTAKEDLEKIVQNLDPATQGSAMIVKNKK
ncbi:MAG TPA: SPOR domain-containing protein [Leptospiraceae bacterium]|nr:SPOR domain-containing protein [Leptospiraceae bacterium]HMW04787.1 SPOR domain-containing protein [Leptospiraceae bacterium]HMX32804.1 SPOR domain-containing protein [Leptospiraceae bacterium]HMY33545.1 SPOR domain-containing protein [Leptospiraceae bacterium]HMZ67565.1 SPOR domain-containing protein [Leptospiraceae bacterium]